MVRTLFAVVAVALLAAVPVQAGKFNKVLKVGDTAPEFKGLPGVDGKSYSLADMKDKDVVVVVFTCNHCPVAVDYEDRIIEFTKKHAGADSKIGIIAICVNDREDDKLEAMKTRATKKGFNFPYVYDESQEAGRAYGATKTPEFFVLNKDRKIVYMGAFDDSNRSPKVSHVTEAVQATLKGETVKVSETAPVGCGIAYTKKK